jgi:excinuclease ABC subunit A
MTHIELRGVRVHNLKGIDVSLPLGKLIAITGVSGAGKSSLAFDTLVAEGRRRYIETFAPSARQFLERIERPDADALENLPPAITFHADASFDQRATLGTMTETDDLLRMLFARLGRAFCPQCDAPLAVHSPDDVRGELQSLLEGTKFVVAFPSEKSDAAIANWRQLGFVRTMEWPQSDISNFKSQISNPKSQMLVVVDRLVAGRSDAVRLLESIEQAYAHGGDRCVVLSEPDANTTEDAALVESDGRRWRFAQLSRRLMCSACEFEFPVLEPDLFNFESPLGACPSCTGLGRIAGSETKLPKSKGRSTNSGAAGSSLLIECRDCRGSRLSAAGRSVRLVVSRTGTLARRVDKTGWSARPTIVELRRMRLSELTVYVDGLSDFMPSEDRSLVANVQGELSARLRMLLDLGLEHLSLDRSPRTLSRGEWQRARLAGVLATRLDNALYVLDEPSGGLHPLDAERVLAEIRRLHQAGNTVILVEHSQAFVDAADEVLELGPGAGREGGSVVNQRRQLTLNDAAVFLADGREPKAESRYPNSSTVNRVETTAISHQPSAFSRIDSQGICLVLGGVTLHNLNRLDVEFPLNRLCVVMGVSGSGKSSLIEHTLYPALCQRFGTACSVDPAGRFASLTGTEQIDEVVFLDSSPIRRSTRANAATMLSLLAEIRQLFAQTTEAKVKNFTARHFSFNASDGGRCPRCRGLGSVEIDMQFLANLTVVCPECHGWRFQRELLDAKLRGLSIAEVLNLSAEEAFTFFRGQPQLQRRLKSLKDVGLGYLPLGQSASTLSRGECQRLKLATLLANRSRKRTLFLMDEPCAGLHARDIAVLLECFRRLIEVGHSLIAIEHRPEFIAAADWLIELGPGAGDAGGKIVAAGTPQ